MGFHPVVFPQSWIGHGSVSGPMSRTVSQMGDAGVRPAGANLWPYPRRRFMIRQDASSIDDMSAVHDFIEQRRGSAHSFLLQDWTDFSTAADRRSPPSALDVSLGFSTGTDYEFETFKIYEAGSYQQIRPLRKLLPGSVLVAFDGVTKTEGLDYTVDYSLGRISTTVSVPANTEVTFGAYFYCQVRFDTSVDDWPAMTWVDAEDGSYSLEMIELKTPQSPPVGEETFERLEIFDEMRHFEGGTFWGSVAPFTLAFDFNSPRGLFKVMRTGVLEIAPTGPGHIFRLPDVQENGYFAASLAPTGGPYYTFLNTSTTESLTLQEWYNAGTGYAWRNLLTRPVLKPGNVRECWLDDFGIWRGA